MKLPPIRVNKVMIPQTPGVCRPRWFVEWKDSSNCLRDIGNYDNEDDARKVIAAFINKWMDDHREAKATGTES